MIDKPETPPAPKPPGAIVNEQAEDVLLWRPAKTPHEAHLQTSLRTLHDSVEYYFNPDNIGNLCDGFHTFNELYRHRVLLFIALCKLVEGAEFLREHYPGWDCVFLTLPTGQICYHVQAEYRPLYLGFAKEVTVSPWDKHESNDVLQRLFGFIEGKGEP